MIEKKTKTYKYLIFDADHTLLHYIADERKAFCALYEKLGMPVTDELLSVSRRASESAWTDAGLYNVTDPTVQKAYHLLYRTHTEEIFRRIFTQFPCQNILAKDAGLRFLEELKIVGEPLGKSWEVIRALSQKGGGRYEVYIATNGLSSIQHKRLEAFERVVEKVFVSEDLQSVKPLPSFFERMLQTIGGRAQDCLMIGDSLVSDIDGAKGVGMDTCWFNPAGHGNATGITPDYEITAIEELLEML